MTRRRRPSPLPFPVQVPFVDALGIELHALGQGRCELHCTLDDDHLNAWAVAHGGVVMTMLDVAMAMASRTARDGIDHGVATVEMKTSFMRPAEGRLRAIGSVQHATATLAFCTGEVFDDHGHLCAAASGTFKYLRGLASRGQIKRTTPPVAQDGPPASSGNDPAPTKD